MSNPNFNMVIAEINRRIEQVKERKYNKDSERSFDLGKIAGYEDALTLVSLYLGDEDG